MDVVPGSLDYLPVEGVHQEVAEVGLPAQMEEHGYDWTSSHQEKRKICVQEGFAARTVAVAARADDDVVEEVEDEDDDASGVGAGLGEDMPAGELEEKVLEP